MSVIHNKYINSKVYKITNNINNICYVGSTTHTLIHRFSGHKSSYKIWLNDIDHTIQCTSYILFYNYGLENCTIQELCTCNSLSELKEKEMFYIKSLDTVNKRIPLQIAKEEYVKEYVKQYYNNNKDIKKEYYIKNKDSINKKQKVKYLENKEKLNENLKEYYIKNKEKLKEYGEKYRLINKKKIKEYGEKYRLINKDLINEKQKVKYLENKEKLKVHII